MRFARVDGARTLPVKGLSGSCPACFKPVVAKCGTSRVHHWAHRGARACDDWWERETEWHRAWKVNFPADWQEVIKHDQLGERHIADVHTEHGLTLEFQHSHLAPEERLAREAFYGDMVWVVDGLRLGRDLPRFLKNVSQLRPVGDTGIYSYSPPTELFPRGWLDSKVPVFFDFGVSAPPSNMMLTQFLWCLLPWGSTTYRYVTKMSKPDFVVAAQEAPDLVLGKHARAEFENWINVDPRVLLAKLAEERKRLRLYRSAQIYQRTTGKKLW